MSTQLPDPQRTHFLWGLSKDLGLAEFRMGFIHTYNTVSGTSFTSTNVKLRLRFDVHLTFHWHSPEPHLTTWPSSDLHLTLTRPLPSLNYEILNFTWNSLKPHLTLTWSSPGVHLMFTWPSDHHLTFPCPLPKLCGGWWWWVVVVGGSNHYRPYLRVLSWLFVNLSRS